MCVGKEGEAAADGDYASEDSEADDEATLEEEDALAAQDGTNCAVSAQSVRVSLAFECIQCCTAAVLWISYVPIQYLEWCSVHISLKCNVMQTG